MELYKQGKTIREIAKEVHMSFSNMGAVVKQEFGPKELEMSKETQVLKLLGRYRNKI